MQTSTAVVFRALVMLACLVAIPLAALVGQSLPDLVRPLLRGEWPWQSASAKETPSEAPPFLPGGMTQAPQVVLGDPIGAGGQPTRAWNLTASPDVAEVVAGSAVVAVVHEEPVPGASPAQPAVWPERALPSATAEANNSGDHFAQMQQRLRELGATYYVLESWGNQEQLYRFYCKVAVGGNASYTHYFEATDSDSLGAMSEVLRQVEAWRAARLAETRAWDVPQTTDNIRQSMPAMY